MAPSVLGFPLLPYGHDDLAMVTVPGTAVRLSLREDVAAIFTHVADWWDEHIEPLVKGTCWGHAPRPVRGSLITLSRHAPGIAIDLNAPQHPLGKRGTLSKGEAAAIRAKCGQLGLRWGGDYRMRADEMHIEGNRPRKDLLAVARELAAEPKRPTPTGWTYGPFLRGIKPGTRVLDLGDCGDDVALLQRYLGVLADRRFGPATDLKVRAYQVMRGLQVDGAIGPRTWAPILDGLGLPR